MSADSTAAPAASDHHRRRILEWDGCHNVRDLGGLPTADGRRIRWGALIRSDQPTTLTEAGRAAAAQHNIGTVVDVRLPEEAARDGGAYAFPELRTSVPFNVERDPADEPQIRAAYAAAVTRAELNRLDIDVNRRGLASVVAAIADAPQGAVLVHCAGGKDRTGAVVAVLLALAGVSDDDIADDYALSMLNLEPLIADWLAAMTSDPAERQRLRRLAMPTREAMLETLAHLRQRYGSPAEYLRGGGVTDEQLRRLRERLVEPAG